MRAIAAWLLVLALAAVPALHVGDVLRGGSDGAPGSESMVAIQRAVDAGLPAGAFYPFIAVLESDALDYDEEPFIRAGQTLTGALLAGGATAVQSVWNTGDAALVGRSGRSTMLIVQPDAADFTSAELATARLREAIAAVELPAGFRCELTGQPAALHDLNTRSSADLLRAERIGLPLVLLILLLVFRSPVAALLPLVLAMTATTLGLAALYLLGTFTEVTVFAQNAVTMIGLGVGVDYALLLVAEFRHWLAVGLAPDEAARRAARELRGTILCSGTAVAIGFLALCIVRLPFLRALAIGGVVVVGAAVVATLTLLPSLLAMLGQRVNWPLRRAPDEAASPFWSRWARRVMRRPLLWSGLVLCVLTVFLLPVLRMESWSLGVSGVPADMESRRGYEILRADFAAGWIGPAAVVIGPSSGEGSIDAALRSSIDDLAARLRRDPRVALVRGMAVAEDGPGGGVAVLAVVGHDPPESRQAAAFVEDLRAAARAGPGAGGATVHVTGATAMLTDFDDEIFSRLWIVVPAVLALTFCVLAWHLRSLMIPLKAVVLNLLSVLASYGFLVLVFQDGYGAGLIGLDPPGGLNAFIVLMLFTILFGLSMDYEVFLLSRIRAEYLRTGRNAAAVELGMARTGGVISSAAAIMVALFVAFGFTQLVATREFGLGLAFAVALDATLIRLVLVPALMVLMGAANWWWPFRPSRPGGPTS